MDAMTAENLSLRRTLRDLVALSALPAAWIGYDPRRLADSLIDFVLNAVRLDFVLLRMHDPAGATPIEIARISDQSLPVDAAGRIVAALSPLLNDSRPRIVKSVPHPLGSGTARIVAVPIGIEGEGGMLIAGSRDPDFPSDGDRLLLNASVNQAAMVLQRRREDEALRWANARLQLAVRGSNIGIWEIDMPDGVLRNGRVDFTNVWEQLGFDRPVSPTDFSTPMSMVHPDDAAPLESAIEAYLAGATAKLEVEHRVRCSDGSYRWMLARGVAVRDSQGRPIRLAGSSIDITEHKQAEKALHESEERFRRYFDLGLIGMAITSPTKGCLEVNDEICRILGYDRHELLAKTWSEMTHPDDLAADVAQFDRVMAGQIDGYTVDKRWVRKDRRIIDTSISVNCVRRADGSVDYFVALLQDVTDRKAAEKALRMSGQRFQEMAEAMPGILFTTRADGLTEYVSGRFYDYTGMPPEMAVADGWQAAIHPDDLESNIERWRVLLAAGIPYDFKFRLRSARGEYRWFLSRSRPICDGSGTLVQWIGTAHDIDEMMQTEAALEQAKEAAERANRIKDQFLATVSHELRTPLAGILLWSQLLESGRLKSEDEAQALRAIRASAQAQQQLIEDLLDISRMLAGEMRLNAREVEPASVVRAALEMVRPVADAKNIRIEEAIETVGGPVWADATRIQQVVLNLLNNAVKFTPDGGRMSLRLRRSGGAVEIQVTDTGQGISSEFLPHVFERFRQADASSARRHGGLGLGLAIARELVELHRGKIRVESPGTGQGATFTVELPISKARHKRPVATLPADSAEGEWRFVPSPILRGVRALVVEDDETTRQVIQYLLQQCEAEVTAIGNAADALREFTASVHGKRFDVLLSDIGLPEMNGHELMKRIRSLEWQSGEKQPTPAVALTAYAREQDRTAALAAGFTSHLVKPVVAATLVKTVAACVGRFL